jgi:hypothetical protein
MAYWDLTILAQDTEFSARVAACYQTETGTADDPNVWAYQHAWRIAAAPGFSDAYASAVESGVPNPGRDPAVISDAQILSAVQPLLEPANP